MFGYEDERPILSDGGDVVQALEEATGGFFDMHALGEDDLEMLTPGFGRGLPGRRCREIQAAR